jgi:thiol-disulfide isomerase/thioredoxin
MKKLTLLMMLCGAFAGQAQDQAKFTARIENRNSDTITLKGRNFNRAIPLKDGVFSDSFSAPKGFYQMTDGTESTQVFIDNGFDLNLAMDAKKFDESIVYTGKGAKENNYLAWMTLQDEKLEGILDSGDAKAMEAALAASTKEAEDKLNDPELDAQFKAMIGAGLKQRTQMMTRFMQQKIASGALKGKPSPVFEYENFKGGKTKLSDFKGKYVYIDVWATWCGPCRQEIPFLQKIEEKYHGKKIEFVSISIDKQKDNEKWKKMVADKSLGGTQLFADNDWQSAWVREYGIESIPRFILIDPSGNIVDADAKRPSDPALQAQLDAILK